MKRQKQAEKMKRKNYEIESLKKVSEWIVAITKIYYWKNIGWNGLIKMNEQLNFYGSFSQIILNGFVYHNSNDIRVNWNLVYVWLYYYVSRHICYNDSSAYNSEGILKIEECFFISGAAISWPWIKRDCCKITWIPNEWGM